MGGSANASVPFSSFGFKVSVSIDGNMALFQEVSGLSAQIAVEDVVEGGRNNTTRKMIGAASYSNITLKRGLCDASMFDWINSFINPSGGKPGKRLDGTIELLGDDAKTVVKKFSFTNGIPVKWDGPSLSVMSDAIATETLEIAHEGLKVEKG